MTPLLSYRAWAVRREGWLRWALAGPGALLGGLMVMAALPLVLPPGPGGIDNLVFPLILAPLLWAVAFFYALLEPDAARGGIVFLAAIAGLGAIVASAFI